MQKIVKYTDGKRTAEITIELNKGRLSICGVVYTGKKLLKSEKNLLSGGQCIDDCKGIIPEQLVSVWERWHLNDMRAGTPKQTEAIDKVSCTFDRLNWYAQACEYLKSIDLYEDNGYRYGSAWLREEIPSSVVDYIASL